MHYEATVTTRVYGLILTYPGITAREINSTLRETCDIDNTAAVNAAIQHLKAKGAVISVSGTTARSTMYYQGAAPAILRSAAGQRRVDVDAVAELTNERAAVMKQYHEISGELAKLMEKMKNLA